MSCGIYKITSPSNKIYIGQSINVERRMRGYRGTNGSKEQRHLKASLLKYGWQKHIFEILQQCEESELNTLEKYYVDLFQSFNTRHGMNLKDGGGNKVRLSDDTKRKISISLKGHKHSDETRKKISSAQKGMISKKRGVPLSDEQKRKLSISLKGRIISEATRKKISATNTGRKSSADFRKKMSVIMVGNKNGSVPCSEEKRIRLINSNRKRMRKVSALSPFNEIVTCDGLNMLCRKYNLKYCNVRLCIMGNRNTHRGWSNFKYI